MLNAQILSQILSGGAAGYLAGAQQAQQREDTLAAADRAQNNWQKQYDLSSQTEADNVAQEAANRAQRTQMQLAGFGNDASLAAGRDAQEVKVLGIGQTNAEKLEAIRAADQLKAARAPFLLDALFSPAKFHDSVADIQDPEAQGRAINEVNQQSVDTFGRPIFTGPIPGTRSTLAPQTALDGSQAASTDLFTDPAARQSMVPAWTPTRTAAAAQEQQAAALAETRARTGNIGASTALTQAQTGVIPQEQQRLDQQQALSKFKVYDDSAQGHEHLSIEERQARNDDIKTQLVQRAAELKAAGIASDPKTQQIALQVWKEYKQQSKILNAQKDILINGKGKDMPGRETLLDYLNRGKGPDGENLSDTDRKAYLQQFHAKSAAIEQIDRQLEEVNQSIRDTDPLRGSATGGTSPAKGGTRAWIPDAEGTASGLGLKVTPHGGARPGQQGTLSGPGHTSLHVSNHARDFSGPPDKMAAFFEQMRDNLPDKDSELFYSPIGFIKRGKFYSTDEVARNWTGGKALVQAHYSHVHIGGRSAGSDDPPVAAATQNFKPGPAKRSQAAQGAIVSGPGWSLSPRRAN